MIRMQPPRWFAPPSQLTMHPLSKLDLAPSGGSLAGPRGFYAPAKPNQEGATADSTFIKLNLAPPLCLSHSLPHSLSYSLSHSLPFSLPPSLPLAPLLFIITVSILQSILIEPLSGRFRSKGVTLRIGLS